MADAFDQAWGVAKFDEQRAQMARTVQQQQEEMAMPDTSLEPPLEEGDVCCQNIKQMYADGVIALLRQFDDSEGDPMREQEVYQNHLNMSCEELKDVLNYYGHQDGHLSLITDFGGMQNTEWAEAERNFARQCLAAWDECEDNRARAAIEREGEPVSMGGDDLMTTSNDVFEDSWAVTKFQPGIKQAWERYESGDSMPALIAGLSGNKSKRHYQKFLTDAFGRTGSEEMIEPNIGGGGGVFGVRPHVAYIGNDYNRFIPNLFRNVRDNPNLLEWKPSEEYTLRVGDPRTLPGLMPGSPIIDLPPVSAQDVRDFHEITGGAGLDSDQMYASNIRFYELRRKMNELMNEGEWRTNPDKSAEMARLTAILLPQMIGGHFRIGDEATHPLNISPRGPSGAQKENVQRKYPSAYSRSQELLDLIHERGGSGKLTINTTLPYIPQRVDKRGRDVDVPYSYEPWSREMRDKKYYFHEGDHVPFLEAVAPYADPEYKSFLLSDPPYFREPGEHKDIQYDTGEPGGFTHRLMSAIRPIVDAGVPTIAFNSARMPRELFEVGGLTDYQVQPRSEKGIQGEARDVMELVGMANIPGMSQEKINEMQSWPDSELPMRGFYRQTAFGQRD